MAPRMIHVPNHAVVLDDEFHEVIGGQVHLKVEPDHTSDFERLEARVNELQSNEPKKRSK